MESDILFGPFPVLKYSGILLKKVEIVHLDGLFALYDNEHVFRMCGMTPKHNKKTVEKMIGHFERDYGKHSKLKWGIFEDGKEELVGLMDVFALDKKANALTIGYLLQEKHWGKGIATRALGCALSFLFTVVGVNRVQAEVLPKNEASKKVLLKNGFRREGTLRQSAYWVNQGLVDLEIYGILRGEYITGHIE